MDRPATSRSRAALNRLVASLVGVTATTVIGSASVAAAYYPLRHAHYAVQWLLIFFLMTFESAAVHLPSEVILPAAGWLVVRQHGLGVPGVVAVSAIAALGNTLGSTLLYGAGRFGGRRLIRRYGRFFLVHEADVDRVESRMGRHYVWALFVSRLLPIVRTYAGFAAGMLRLPLAPFASVTFAGSFCWCLVFVTLGAMLGQQWSSIRGPMEIAGAVVLLGILAAAAFVAYRTMAAERAA